MFTHNTLANVLARAGISLAKVRPGGCYDSETLESAPERTAEEERMFREVMECMKREAVK